MDNIKGILELFYFLSGPVIVFIALYGLKQLKISKDTNKLNAKRESFRLAGDQYAKFLEKIIPLVNELDKIVLEQNCKLMNSKIEIKDNSIILDLDTSDLDIEKFRPLLEKALHIANLMEGIAIFFTTGVAAEEVAYRSIGKTYCHCVKDLMPIILIGASSKHYENIIKLFFIWYNRIESEKLLIEKEKIGDRIKSLKNKKITPLGLEE